MSKYTVDGRIGRMIVRGRTLWVDVAEQTLDGSVSLSTDGATQLGITVSDPDLLLLRSRVFDKGGQIDWAHLKMTVAALELDDAEGGPRLMVTGRSLGWRKLKRAKGPLVRRKVSPTEFVRMLAVGAGLRFVGEPTARRSQIARQTGDQAESSWDTIQRLAQEVGFLAFEAGGTLYFGRPTWLVARAGARLWPIVWSADENHRSSGLLKVPHCRTSEDDDTAAAEVTVELVSADADQVLPGDVLPLSGVPGFDGRYLITTVDIPLSDAAPVVVTAKTPTNPVPQPPQTAAATSSSTAGKTSIGGSSTSGVEKFVAAALAQAGDNYVFGAEARASDPDPDAFDCSELVEWAAAQADAKMPDGSGNQRAYCQRKGTIISVDRAIKTRGALLFANGHVAISLGNGRTIEAVNRQYGVRQMNAKGRQSVRWIAGGLVPGLRYP